MKKIIFMLINMNVGGTEKSLLNMIAEMSAEKYDITIIMLEEYGDFLGQIPKNVTIKYVDNYKYIKDIINEPPKKVLKDTINKKNYIEAFNLLILYFISKLKQDRSPLYKYVLRKNNTLDEIYDLAVAYAGPMDFITYYILENIKSRKKVQWIHFDVEKIGFNVNFAKKYYSKMDKVYVVSSEGKQKLLNLCSNLDGKVEVFLNVASKKIIKSQSREQSGFCDKFDGIRILTVGRLTYQKGQDLVIPVLARLVDEGYNVKWYCIGDGNLKSEYENLIKQYNVEDNFILLGQKKNPYPYMQECDIYVQPSRFEGYCTTVVEAKCLNKPIIVTNVNGSNEIIKENKTGLIVDIDEEEIYNATKLLLDNQTLRFELSKNIEKENVNTSKEINKLELVLSE